ncbi:N-acetylmuramoyl-L-alanine amidase [Sulfobacillus sp. DSM 109850]|uniref:N-acetylmuramoyl-L-alanine amidase n=2 Tax=Sulfobacillus harzensis TaxID=2729629 RepID=A0A7Y0Q1D4_9FIRM|nr:N-acetylmuramoyl-L-alanine amidase [Sulfobacillus harzensis]
MTGSFVLTGRAASAPPEPANRILPPLVGDLLEGRTVIIDPGHGGYDPGALGRRTQEAAINLAIGLQLRKWFQMAGARVLMTWSKPSEIPPNKKYRVQDRLTWINQQNGDVLIDIHCNSGSTVWRNPQTFYWDGAASYHLASDVQEELRYFTKSRRGVKRINQYVLRHARMPAINVEVGYVTNPVEEKLLTTPQYQKELTWAIFIGTERWLVKGRWPAELLEAPPPVDLLKR